MGVRLPPRAPIYYESDDMYNSPYNGKKTVINDSFVTQQSLLRLRDELIENRNSNVDTIIMKMNSCLYREHGYTPIVSSAREAIVKEQLGV